MIVEVRPRTPGDVPALGEVLAAQQPTSRYPMRWPLPFPVADFIVRPGELAAWTALVDGRPVGHVAVTEVGEDGFAAAWSAGHGLPTRRLGVVTSFFVDPAQRRTGLGRQLHDTAVGWLRAAGREPCLDVVPLHEAATAMYAGLGWVEVGRGRPGWLPAYAPDVVAMVLPRGVPAGR